MIDEYLHGNLKNKSEKFFEYFIINQKQQKQFYKCREKNK